MTDYLLNKYNVPAPRYTSYPTVPYWDKEPVSVDAWQKKVKSSFQQSNQNDGISIYIHLPFCESLCTYCGCNTRITKNHGVELPYLKALLKEWNMYCETFGEKPVIKEIHLGGGTPTFFKPENLKYLIGKLLAGVTIHPQAEFSFEAHPGNTTVDHLQTLFDLGFRRLSLGIQDFDPKVQLIINRIQSVEQVRMVTLQARRIGYNSVNYDLIYGLPLQTPGGLADTLDKVQELMPDRIAFYSYAHVPWIKPGQRRFTENDLPDTTAKAALYELGRERLAEMGYKDIGMDHFALPADSLYRASVSGDLHRNFMGYTHQYTRLLIGLGVSAIGDTWDAYAQNVKTVEEYLTLINNDTLPIVKGHHLTKHDLIIRRHLLNIMCKGYTNWAWCEDSSIIAFNSIGRMQDLADDGLIVLDSEKLVVTAAGIRFLRNICLALDARFWADKPSAQLFSMAG